jgi:hypothetical protein
LQVYEIILESIDNMKQNEDNTYLLGETQREVERLQKQHAWMRACLKGKLIFAPVDLQKPDLKVLDVGCADGMAHAGRELLNMKLLSGFQFRDTSPRLAKATPKLLKASGG